MTQSLKNKVALVTGGSRGIGAAIVRRLAAEGASVAFTYSSSPEAADKLAAELGKSAKVQAYRADAGKIDQAAPLVQSVVKDFGRLDILVNNAGIFDGMGNLGEIDPKGYKKVIDVNVDGVFAVANEAAKVMKSGARIINISSCLGERAGQPGISSYIASKFAVTGFTRAWARDLGAKGILVNAIQPGPIDTDMNPANGEYAEAQRVNIPLGRYGKPDEIAGLAAFLAGPDATFINGAAINVDGGWNA